MNIECSMCVKEAVLRTLDDFFESGRDQNENKTWFLRAEGSCKLLRTKEKRIFSVGNIAYLDRGDFILIYAVLYNQRVILLTPELCLSKPDNQKFRYKNKKKENVFP